MSKNKKIVAVFDFDGTLTNGDTFLPFLAHSFGLWKTTYGILYNLPFIIGYLIKIISNEYAKSKIIKFFLKNEDTNTIESYCQNFLNDKLDSMVNNKVFERLIWHQKKNHITILISASLKVYVEPWAKKYNFDYIEATELMLFNNKYTGLIKGKNCYGIEKVHRLKKILNDEFKEYELFGYGDGRGDKFFLNLCNHKFDKRKLSTLKNP